MTTIELGAEAHDLVVHLTPGADFVTTVTTSDGTDWPATATLVLEFEGGTSWPATIEGSEATWDVDKGTVDALIAGGRQSVRLIHTDGTYDAVWAIGRTRW